MKEQCGLIWCRVESSLWIQWTW